MSIGDVKAIMWWCFWIMFFNLMVLVGTILGSVYCHKNFGCLSVLEVFIFIFAGGIFYTCQSCIVKKAEKNS